MLYRKLLFFLLAFILSHFALAQLNIVGTTGPESCNGYGNGSITLYVSGGVSPYSYSWSNGATTRDISNLSAGTYTVTVRDQAGVTAFASYLITEQVKLNIEAQITNADCSNNGGIYLEVSGGTAPYGFGWSNGAGTKDITNLAAGYYSVEIKDANGCKSTVSYTVQDASSMNLTFDKRNIDCAGNNGRINLSVSGGFGPYSYQWSNGATSKNLNNLAAGTYTVAVKDATGCIKRGSISIDDANSLTLDFALQDALCTGQANGAVNLSVSGGNAPFQYQWSNGALTEDITGLAAGTYSVIVTDGGSCTATASVTVATPELLEIGASVTPVSSCNGTAPNGTINLEVRGGKAPYTFKWSDGETLQNRTALASASYSVIVKDANSCEATAEMLVGSAPIYPEVTLVSSPNEACDTNFSGAIAASITSGSPVKYTLLRQEGQSEVVVNTGNAGVNGSLGFTGLQSGSYRLEVVQNGCITYGTIIVGDQIGIPLITAATSTDQTNCDIEGNGTASVTAVSYNGTAANLRDYTFVWKDAADNFIGNGATLSGLAAGTYFVSAVKTAGNPASGCASVPYEVVVSHVPVPANISLSTTPNTSCNTNYNGSISTTISGAGARYSWSWLNVATGSKVTGTETYPADQSLLAPGLYQLTVTSINGCTITASVTVANESAAKAFTYYKGDPSCAGGNNGWIAVVKKDNTSYTCSKNGVAVEVLHTGKIEQLSAGVYEVKALNTQTGCEYTETITLTDPAPLQLSETIQQISAYEATDASISVIVAGGKAPYTYLWSNGATSSEISGIAPATYTLTVTDANGCQLERSFVIEPKAPLGLEDGQTAGIFTLSKTAAGLLRVQLENGASAQQLALYTLDGRLVSSTSMSGKQAAEVQLSTGEPTIYLLVITVKDKAYRRKILF